MTKSPGARVRIDCRKRTSREVLRDIAARLTRPGGGGQIVLTVDNLHSLEGSVAGFLKDLVRQVVESGVRMALVDRSGYASAFVDAMGGVVPLDACSGEGDVSKTKRVLIVEDHADSLDFLRTLIESAGHSCETARSADEAIRKLGGGAYDLIFLDMVLPDLDGRHVAQFILDRKKQIPVVAVSAYLDRWDDATYRRLHIRRRISKPYRVKEILDAIRNS